MNTSLSPPNLPCVGLFTGVRESIRKTEARAFKQISDGIQRKEISGDSPNLSADSRLSISKQDKAVASPRDTSSRNAGRGCESFLLYDTFWRIWISFLLASLLRRWHLFQHQLLVYSHCWALYLYIASELDIDPASVDALRAKCVRDVKKTNGGISFKEAVLYQKGID